MAPSMSQSEFLSLIAVCSILVISRQCGTNDIVVYSCSIFVRARETLLVLGQIAVAGASFVCAQETLSGWLIRFDQQLSLHVPSHYMVDLASSRSVSWALGFCWSVSPA
jgi:hypothetical protein